MDQEEEPEVEMKEVFLVEPERLSAWFQQLGTQAAAVLERPGIAADCSSPQLIHFEDQNENGNIQILSLPAASSP